MTIAPLGQVVAFYGYKGGTGRSMLLANAAYALAAHGKSVIVIDCDLEAPGIGDYFDVGIADLSGQWRGHDGLVDMLRRALDLPTDADPATVAEEAEKHVEEALLDVTSGPVGSSSRGEGGAPGDLPFGSIRLIGPGSHNGDQGVPMGYVARAFEFDWSAFGATPTGDEYLRAFDRALRARADFVLIDARTGYNYASLLLLRAWKPGVIGISTFSWQSLEGLARMRRVHGSLGLETAVVMCKVTEDGQIEADAKRLLLKNLMPGAPIIAELPFVPELAHGDRLLWARPSVWSTPTRSGAAASPEAAFVAEFTKVFQYLTGTAFDRGRVQQFVEAVRNRAAEAGSGTKAVAGDGQPPAGDQGPVLQLARRAFEEPRLDFATYHARFNEFFQAVRAYCETPDNSMTGGVDRDVGSPAGGADRHQSAGQEDSPPSLATDPIIRQWRIEYRELARVDLARRIEDAIEETSQGGSAAAPRWHPDRIAKVRDENFIRTIAIPPADIPDPPRPDSETRFYAEFGRLMNQGRSDQAGEIAIDAETGEQREALELLRLMRRSRLEDAGDPSTIELGEAIGRALDGVGFRVPIDDIGLQMWNGLDFLQDYVDAAARAVRSGSGEALLLQMRGLEARVLAVLARCRPTSRNGAAQWQSYLLEAVRLRRSGRQPDDEASRIPHPLDEILTREEAATLAGALDVDAGSVPTEAELPTLALATNALSVATIWYLSGQIQQARDMFRGLVSALVRRRRHGSDQPAWRSLVVQATGVAEAFRDSASRLLLWRLALRHGSPGGSGPSHGAIGLSIALADAGIPMHPSGMIDRLPQKDHWWKATDLAYSGQLRDARTILDRARTETGPTRSLLTWLVLAEARLGTAETEQRFGEWWDLRRGEMKALMDEERTWLVLAQEALSRRLATGNATDPDGLLRRALEVATRREAVDGGRWAGIDIHCVLVAARNGTRPDGETLKRLEARVVGYREAVAAQTFLGADRAFAGYLGVKWDQFAHGQGLFGGDEYPSHARRWMADALIEYAEVLLHAGRSSAAAALGKEVEDDLLGGYDEHSGSEGLGRSRLAYCYPIAAASAIRYAASAEGKAAQRAALLDRATRHRDADVGANGSSRNVYYQRIFEICRMPVRPWSGD